jgi:hypothetical protein
MNDLLHYMTVTERLRRENIALQQEVERLREALAAAVIRLERESDELHRALAGPGKEEEEEEEEADALGEKFGADRVYITEEAGRQLVFYYSAIRPLTADDDDGNSDFEVEAEGAIEAILLYLLVNDYPGSNEYNKYRALLEQLKYWD